MLREMFIGRVPSHFELNSIVKAFIVGEMMLWSGWNSVYPIIALFAISLPQGDIKSAASAYSIYLVARVFTELISGRLLTNHGDFRKFVFTIVGIFVVSCAYIGFARATALYELFLFYAVAGIGMGFAAPAKTSLFSTHLDKNKEAMEWGMVDAAVFLSMALSGALGGFIADQYGFQFLFYVATGINLLSLIPYFLYMKHERREIWRVFFPLNKRN